ncbi:MAG: hypothetical protein H0W15_00405 [Gemmatimonadales bacterium]|nr:hypothetical protein [Gemmatimonadales bacterium]
MGSTQLLARVAILGAGITMVASTARSAEAADQMPGKCEEESYEEEST